jgi:epoxyqueuosine reductase
LLREQAALLGFQQLKVSGIDLQADGEHLKQWLQAGFHGEMAYMAKHGEKRSHPAELEPGTLRVISCRMDYLPDTETDSILQNPQKAYISRYALGRDYHKLMRKRLSRLASTLVEKAALCGTSSQLNRAFVDSAPVLERAIAQQAGLGWIGKNTMLINPKAGSWFFLGEIFTDIPLPIDPAQENPHCGSCTKCLDLCPTRAFVKPWQLDARRCISYLTIELKDAIPLELRPLMGNRIYGCDDCQLVCPWNKFAQFSAQDDFQPRHHLDNRELQELFKWSEATFLEKTAGSAIRRIGYECWLRNLAVALGNAPYDPAILTLLASRRSYPSALVQEHIEWAITRQQSKAAPPTSC